MSDIEKALRVAFRHFDAGTTTEAERDAILAAVASHAADRTEAETAARALHHRQEARSHQLHLTALINAHTA